VSCFSRSVVQVIITRLCRVFKTLGDAVVSI
jgi:hypothetical protein